MKVGFYTCWKPGDSTVHMLLGDRMIRSVRKAMPGVEIVQFTDADTPQLHGTTGVNRLPSEPLALHTARHYSLIQGEWLLVDTDVVIQRDVREVFNDEDFDVGVVSRNGTLLANELSPSHSSARFMEEMPYNIGVVFSRRPEFWAEVTRRIEAGPEPDRHWMANQRVACGLIREQKYKIKVLEPDYNYPPVTATEDVSQRAIVHYKGPTRKTWMLARFREGV